MTMMNRRRVVLSAAACIFFPAAWGAETKDGRALLEAFLSEVKGAEGTFTQETHDQQGILTARAEGGFAFCRPGSFDWVIESPYRQRIVSDGARLSIYDEDLLQVTEKRLEGAYLSTPAAVLFGEGRIPPGWRVRAEKREVTLLPGAAQGGLESVRVSFGGTGMPEFLELLDGFGQRTLIRFTRFAPGMPPAERFRFTPPEGVEIIRDPA